MVKTYIREINNKIFGVNIFFEYSPLNTIIGILQTALVIISKLFLNTAVHGMSLLSRMQFYIQTAAIYSDSCFLSRQQLFIQTVVFYPGDNFTYSCKEKFFYHSTVNGYTFFPLIHSFNHSSVHWCTFSTYVSIHLFMYSSIHSCINSSSIHS